MRKLVLQIGLSIDEFVAARGGAHDWGYGREDDGAQRCKLDSLRRAGAQVMGRATYEAMAAVWPTSTSAYAAPMNEIPKIGFSATLQTEDRGGARIARGKVLTCLLSLRETDLRAPPPAGASDDELERIICGAVRRKELEHRAPVRGDRWAYPPHPHARGHVAGDVHRRDSRPESDPRTRQGLWPLRKASIGVEGLSAHGHAPGGNRDPATGRARWAEAALNPLPNDRPPIGLPPRSSRNSQVPFIRRSDSRGVPDG